ncbi:MAG: hypothetical protein MK183_05990 [Verrucomicrobiales bacterium]|nr:hypothetical protein [Verrucomicrobiales bacterium]
MVIELLLEKQLALAIAQKSLREKGFKREAAQGQKTIDEPSGKPLPVIGKI